jgi:hypothetical protein
MSTTALKDQALQEYYEALFAMYATPGWVKLMEDIGRMDETHDKLVGLETEAQLWFRHGQLDIIRLLKNHQATAEATYNELLAEEDGSEPEPSSSGTAKAVA